MSVSKTKLQEAFGSSLQLMKVNWVDAGEADKLRLGGASHFAHLASYGEF